LRTLTICNPYQKNLRKIEMVSEKKAQIRQEDRLAKFKLGREFYNYLLL